MKRITIFSFLVLLSYTAFAQKALEIKRANKLYASMQYGPAIPFYEAVLERDTGSIEVKSKLADCYRKINDTKNSERLYEGLAKGNSGNAEFVLRYAEALSENGKYNEAKNWYGQYQQLNHEDQRGQQNTSTISQLSRLYRDSSNYQLQSLQLNSPQADFSPMYYKKGLIFCSGRRQGAGVKKVFTWNQSAFLDLYTVADTATIGQTSYQTIPAVDLYDKVVYDNNSKDNRKHHTPYHADDTYSTSNDSRTVGYYNSTLSNAGKRNKNATRVSSFSKMVNSSYHEGPVSFYKNDDSVLFTRNNFYKSKYKKAKDGTNRLKIYSAVYKDGVWTNVKNFPLNNDEYSVGHPALTPDNQTLYFVSDMPGGFGGSDIWVSKYENGQWTTPMNAGKNINTAGQEMFPYIDTEGNLFYSSDGLGGLGGLDIFFAQKEGNRFKAPVNIGFPLNSSKDDFGIITDSKLNAGYLSSNRKSGGYDDDIYSFHYKGPKNMLLEGIVVDKFSQKALDSSRVVLYRANAPSDSMVTTLDGLFTSAKIFPDENYVVKVYRNRYKPDSTSFSTFNNERGDTIRAKVVLAKKEIFVCARGKVIGQDDKQPMAAITVKLYNKCTNTSVETLTDADGNYKLCMMPDACYTLSAERNNCATTPYAISTNGLQDDFTFIHEFEMLCQGDIVKLDNIYYDLGKFNIRPDAAKELEKIVPLMNKYPGMRIELRSHTDSRGSNQSNLALSDKRAKAAAAYIVSKGIAKNRIIGKGYGESLPLNKCTDGVECSEEEHQLNRRTEFKILSMGTGSNNIISRDDPYDTCRCKIKTAALQQVHEEKSGIKLKGKIYYEITQKGISNITLLLTNNTDRSYKELQSDAEGGYSFELKSNSKYTLTASKEGCTTYTKDISTDGITGSTAILENIPFVCE